LSFSQNKDMETVSNDLDLLAFAIQQALSPHIIIVTVDDEDAKEKEPFPGLIFSDDGILPLIGERIALPWMKRILGRNVRAKIVKERPDATLFDALLVSEPGAFLGHGAIQIWLLATIVAFDAACATSIDPAPLSRRLRWLANRFSRRIPDVDEWLSALNDPACPPKVKVSPSDLAEAVMRYDEEQLRDQDRGALADFAEMFASLAFPA